jgi:glutathione-regulated potassium-efflux system protein KefB
LFIGLALSLSSTAFALQVLEENGELTARHGRLAFSVLLFQDLAAIPLIALAPFFAVTAVGVAPKMDLSAAGIALLTIALVVAVGRFAVDPLLQFVARARVKEAMTAAALLVVVAVSLVMQKAGISASLGAFIAGALLADSSYRHQLEADLKPFEGLLLGLFFTAVGMSLNLSLLVSQPLTIALFAIGMIAVKGAILYALGLWQKLEPWGARRMALSLSQGGEFAFVLLSAGVAASVLSRSNADLLSVVVTLTMAATPLLLMLDSTFLGVAPKAIRAFDTPPEQSGHIIIAGFGRFGQITARVLRAKRIAFTALDISPEQIAVVSRFGNKIFYGDASRLDILAAAQADRARALVLAIDDIDASLRTAAVVRENFPTLPIYARARNRAHVHRLMDLGVTVIRRETFLASLDLTRELLRGLGYSERDVRFAIDTFRDHDERRLVDDYRHFTDVEKLQDRARSDAANLEKLFDEDAQEQAKRAAARPKEQRQ